MFREIDLENKHRMEKFTYTFKMKFRLGFKPASTRNKKEPILNTLMSHLHRSAKKV